MFALALLAAGYYGYWRIMAGQLDDGLTNWVAERRAEGVDISFRERVLDGFPLRLRLKLEGIDIAASGDKPWRWKIPAAEAWAAPWRLHRVRFRTTGAHDVMPGTTDPAAALTLAAKTFEGDLRLARGGGADLNIVAEAFVADRKTGRLAAMKRLDLDLGWRPLAGAAGVSEAVSPLRLDLGLDGARLPPQWTTPLGRDVETLRLRAHITGPLAGGPLPAALARWRDAGGTLEFEKVALFHGPLRLEAEGTAALDQEMRFEAAFSARAEGFLEIIDSLAAARMLKPGEATAAKLVLTVIAKRPAGQRPYVEAPLTLQNGRLSAGAVSLGRLRRIDWSRFENLRLPGG